jgi:mycothiol synthase
MDVTLRPLTAAHTVAWADLLAEVERVDHAGDYRNVDSLEEELRDSSDNGAENIVGAFEGGDLVGYFGVLPRGESEGAFTVHLRGAVVPTRRGEGIGTKLVAAMVARGTSAAAERRPDLPVRLSATGLSTMVAQGELLTAHGLRAERWNLVMRTGLQDLPDARALPQGYEFRGYETSMDTALLAAHNHAFDGSHPNFTRWSDIMWTREVTGSHTFRPAATIVVVAAGSDQIVGYVVTHEFEGYLRATGRREAYITKVGVVPEHRGRGISAALLSYALPAFRHAGYDEAALDVDAQNPTGALRVYERVGFSVESRWIKYFLTVPVQPSTTRRAPE